MIVRRAAGADLELAHQALTEVHCREAVNDAAVEKSLADPSCYLMLAIEDGRVIGSLIGHALRKAHRRELQFLLYEIDVRQECRNRGVGRALVEAFVAEARAAGAFEIWVLTNQSNLAAMKMYSACGFRRVHGDDVMFSLDLRKPGS